MMEIQRNDVAKLIEQLRKTIYTDSEMRSILGIVEEEDYDNRIQGISNEYLSDWIETIIGRKVQVVGEVEDLYECPCCGYKTLTEQYNVNEGTGYDICPFCLWEDDGTTDANDYRSINRGTIADYRKRITKEQISNKWLKGRGKSDSSARA